MRMSDWVSDVCSSDLLCNARAMGEFGAVSVVSGHIRGLTNTLPLHVEILYNEYNFVGAFAVASLLASLALVTLVAKSILEWRLDYHRRSEEHTSELQSLMRISYAVFCFKTKTRN